MFKVRIFFALGLALLYFAEPYIGFIPLAIWAVAYPAFLLSKIGKVSCTAKRSCSTQIKRPKILSRASSRLIDRTRKNRSAVKFAAVSSLFIHRIRHTRSKNLSPSQSCEIDQPVAFLVTPSAACRSQN